MKPKPERAGVPAPILAQLPVFEHKGELVTDSWDVAPFIEKEHKHLLWDIRRYVKVMSNSTSPKLDTLNYFIEATYIDEKDETRPNFYCTEMGCEMVANKMTGDKGIIFTAQYARAFHAMQDELTQRRELRAIGKPIRRSLTDAIWDSGEVERMKGHAYSCYTSLAFKLATGKTARQLRGERGAAKDTQAVDILTVAELTYSVTEAAQALGVSRRTMYDLINREGFPTLKVGGRRLISRKLLAEWVRVQAGGQKEAALSVDGTKSGKAEQV